MRLTIVRTAAPKKGDEKVSSGASSKSKAPFTVDLAKTDSTVDDLKREISKVTGMAPERQRLTIVGSEDSSADKKPVVLEDGALLSGPKYAELLKDGGELRLKDLGPQISWKLVFIIEYLGPLFLHILFCVFRETVYGAKYELSAVQKVACVLFTLHFLKRELETLFVHRFSHGTMPFTFVFKNSAHYWLLAGVNAGYFVYGPWLSASSEAGQIRSDPTFLAICVALFAFAEFSNLTTHIILRNLRPPGTRVRRIPRGYGFDLISCPNYFFEIMAWVVFSAMTGSWAAWLFTLAGGGQMVIWAQKKHKTYKREFANEYPKNRKILVPFIW
ncbi:hypothetical protein GQ42DRAFT_163762 [Ramicandelaber brevisporus]|nr:hypothetical protein GQ42DRAFT_163762 [Ramicandelaber brevisporus]